MVKKEPAVTPALAEPYQKSVSEILLIKFFEVKANKLREKYGLKTATPVTDQISLTTNKWAEKEPVHQEIPNESEHGPSFHLSEELSHIQIEHDTSGFPKDSFLIDSTWNIHSPKGFPTRHFLEDKMPTNTMKFQQTEKQVKPHIAKPTRDCMGCGMRQIYGEAFVCEECKDIYLCYNCHMEKESKHPGHTFKLIQDDKPMNSSKHQFTKSEFGSNQVAVRSTLIGTGTGSSHNTKTSSDLNAKGQMNSELRDLIISPKHREDQGFAKDGMGRVNEDLWKQGDLFKIYACICSSGADKLSGMDAKSVVTEDPSSPDTLTKQNFEQAMRYDPSMSEFKEPFFASIVNESVSSVIGGKHAIIFCKVMDDMNHSFFLEGNSKQEEPGLIRRVVQALLDKGKSIRTDFVCFKLNNDIVLDVNDNDNLKQIKQKPGYGEEKNYIENLKVVPLTSMSDFNLIFDHIQSDRRGLHRLFHWVYAFNVYPQPERRKVSKVSLVIVDLAGVADKPSNSPAPEGTKSISESLGVFKQLVISLSDPNYYKNSKGLQDKNSRLSKIIYQYLIGDCSVKFCFELTPSSEYEKELREVKILADQLRRAKRQIMV